jgi:hypothetical protein
MVQPISKLLPELAQAQREIRGLPGRQVDNAPIRERMHALAKQYFADVRPVIGNIEGLEEQLPAVDSIFTNLHQASRKRSSKERCLQLLASAKAKFVEIEGLALSRGAKRSAGSRTPTDDLIVESLQDICPSAAQSYLQALEDLGSETRLSYRGPATDLREALRETLDTLAPDKEVEAVPGYKPETEARRPTMKQKVRLVLRNRGLGASQLAAPESAVEGVEEILGGMVRSVYTRSNVSTHSATTRAEVVRLHAWVRLVMCELLEIPL